jgi:hypothetical protein
MVSPVCGQAQAQDQFDLTVEQVARTLSDRGMRIADNQISLLAKVVATEPHPVLDIISVAPFGEGSSAEHPQFRSKVKLACHLPGTCLPFYAIVSCPKEAVATAGENAPLPVSLNVMLKRDGPVTMRVGTHAMLVMNDTRSRVEVSVISLENGNAGDKIRVASSDHKQFYTGVVIGANSLLRSY